MNRPIALLLFLFGLSAFLAIETTYQPSNFSNTSTQKPDLVISENLKLNKPDPKPTIKRNLTYSKADFETENVFLSIMLRKFVDLDRSPELIGKIRNSDIEQFSEGRSMLEDTLNKGYIACDEYMKERNETHKTYSEILNGLPSEESRQSAEITINHLCPSIK